MANDPVMLSGVVIRTDKYGVSSVEAPFLAETYDDAINFLTSRRSFKGLPMVEGSQATQQEDGRYVIAAKFEGVPPSIDPANIAEVDFSWDGTMDQESIKTHPKYLTLKKLFGWDEENQEFPEIAPESASEEGLPGDGQSDEEQTQSALSGTNSWLVVGGEYSITFVSRTVPSSVFSGIGTIVERPPGINFFNIRLGKRTFLKLNPRINKRGNVVEITLRYRLSGPRGIPKMVYSAGQLDPDSGQENEAQAGWSSSNPINDPIEAPFNPSVQRPISL